jgi:hypothetical protein
MTSTEASPSGPDPVSPDPVSPDPMSVVWKRMAVVAVVGVVLVGLAAGYLSARPAHAQSARAGPNVPVSVSCPTTQFCVAVDDQGNALRFEGGVWSRPHSLQATGLNSVSCTSPTFCVAVGLGGDAFVLRGATWSAAVSVDHKSAGEADSFGTSGLSAVSCTTTTFCMAGDVLGHVSTFNGQRWTHPERIEPRGTYETDRKLGTVGITGLSCASPSFCVAVTVAGRAVVFDGASWSSPVTLESAQEVGVDRVASLPALAAVSCPSTTMCVAVDPGGIDRPRPGP